MSTLLSETDHQALLQQARRRLRQSRATLDASSKTLEDTAFLRVVLVAMAAVLPRLPPED